MARLVACLSLQGAPKTRFFQLVALYLEMGNRERHEDFSPFHFDVSKGMEPDGSPATFGFSLESNSQGWASTRQAEAFAKMVDPFLNASKGTMKIPHVKGSL